MIRFSFYTYTFFVLVSLSVSSQTNCTFFSTYFGGSQFDEIKSICTDSIKNTYIIANTYSTDLPVTPGIINDTHSGNYDVFISKLDSCGNLIWSTYFGTPNFDSGEKMMLCADGNIVFCGYSSGTNLPVSSSCFQSTNNGGYDCFITKINPSGTILWCTYFGKTNGDFAYDITCDALNNIIIGGTTTSANLYTTINSFQPNLKGNTDSFIARFSKDGALKWCTYYGGNGNEDIHAITVDSNYNIIGVGGTFSSNLNTSSNAYQQINEGSPDAYIIKLDTNCVRVFSTYLGGTGIDDAWGVTIDLQDNIYVAGQTNSSDFDTTSNAYQTTLNGTLNDGYLSKWSPSGTLLNSTYFGGTGNDYLTRLKFSSPNSLLLLGKTESADMPMFGNNNQTINAGGYDGFVCSFNVTNLQPYWSTYYGGDLDDDPLDIDCNFNTIVFVGTTNSSDYPLSSNPYQSNLQNSNDGIITKLSVSNLTPTVIMTNEKDSFLSIFPNPFQEALYMNVNSKIQIRNILGQIVYESKNERIIDTRYFEKGVYLINLESPQQIKAFKFVKN